MRLSYPLVIREASIDGVSLKHKDGLVTSRIKIKGECTPDLAALLGCHEVVYQSGGLPRPSFEEVKLDGGCEGFSAFLQVEGLRQNVKLQGEKVTEIAIEKHNDLTLDLSLRLQCLGDPLPFLHYWVLVGGAAGLCTVTPLQQELIPRRETPGVRVVSMSDGKEVVQ
jgi:hypothetical protein